MKTTQETVYRCEFCNRAMFGAGAMSLHEKRCKKNPKNKHKCFEYCAHLVRSFNQTDFNEDEFLHTEFTCAKTGKNLWSYKAERFSSFDRFKPGRERMPAGCDLYELHPEHYDYTPDN